ncbi:NADH-quinone oxidoreductase subunit F [Fusibacter sp. 3D3]|uniref:complex I 51 kDa subunit family protein n=1 Tax=Fusibacter sp. 3D3 TaxID=1048380 RepID=UPI000853154B|nr:NADH-ubiquinone oxidoreductase-F iron-sulfur binding region domain-containing protein [Fusibacter sp. 3D3]GAU76823.1 NADH-ubiquinone oxidoreductase chain F [Fusibacter sp. 3D3]
MNFITKNFGKYDGKSLDAYLKLGGFQALEQVIGRGPRVTIEAIKASGLQGRGGAEYPTGRKIEQARLETGERKFLICNADEGEPGTFKDRELLKNDIYQLIEGMIIVAYCSNAKEGVIYCRAEYDWMHESICAAVLKCKEAGFLGENILDGRFDFDICLFSGAGSYVCGEGFAMCESMEGKSGKPRSKPPYVKQEGYLNYPTLVVNVETLSAVTAILKNGVDQFVALGTPDCPGTKLVSISGKVNKPGVFEVPFGISFNEMIALAGGIRGDKKIGFIQVGGASGGILPPELLSTPFTYSALKSKQVSVGSGAIVVADEEDSVMDYLENVSQFFIHESCGKCVPCREGNRQLGIILSKLKAQTATAEDLKMYQNILEVMSEASLCGSGRTEPVPFKTAYQYFEATFLKQIQ